MSIENSCVFCSRCGTRHAGEKCPCCGKVTDSSDTPVEARKRKHTPTGSRRNLPDLQKPDGAGASRLDAGGRKSLQRQTQPVRDDEEDDLEESDSFDQDVDDYGDEEDEDEDTESERARGALMDKCWKVFVTILVCGVALAVSIVLGPAAPVFVAPVAFVILREVWK